jgi:nitrate/TMAO reductase-like tetraheme cytochrome c subunit
MPNKRLIEAGHLLAMLFVALLLAGANQYLGAHPFIAGLLLAAFAFPYYTAARITGERQFLYPAVLLLVLAYQLLLHGMGIAPALQPLFALLPLAVIYTVASQSLARRPERASQALYGANGVLIGAMALWVLFRLAWFYHQAPLATALALAGYCAYASLRYRATGKILHSLAMVLLGSGAFLVFLYWRPQLAVLLATATGLLIWGLFYRRADGPALPRLETGALLAAGAYLLYLGTVAAGPALIPFGYLVAATIWLQLTLALNRPQQPDILGPDPAVLPSLLPLFGAGIALALAPVVLFYPWTPIAPAVGYLAVFSFVFAATGWRLAQGRRSLIGVAAARLIAGLGRVAPLGAFAYIAVQRFPAGLRLAAGAGSLGLISLLWAYRQRPRLFLRRNYYAYQAGSFLILAYYLVERRLAAAGSRVDLAAGAGAVLVVLATAWLLRKRVPEACWLSLYEVASVGAIVAALIYPVANPIDLFTAAEFGMPIILVSAIAFLAVRKVSVLFSIPVALAFWLYIAEWLLGVRGEWLGVPYLVFGLAWAAAAYRLSERASRWAPLLYFMWFVSVGVSLALFSPYQSAGAWLAPLWPVAFVLVARGSSSRRDPAFAGALEAVGGLLAIGATGALLWQHLYAPVAFALLVYALLYAWVAARRGVWPYVYAAAASAVAAFHLELLAVGWALLSLPLFLLVAAAFSLFAMWLRRRGNAREALPLDLAAAAGASAGAAILLALRFGQMATIGWASGLAYLALYLALSYMGAGQVFLAGAGLSGAFAIYEFLPALAPVTAGNHIAFLIPIALVLVLLGRWRQAGRDARGAWALYAAAIAITVAASFFVLGPVAVPAAARIVLLVALAVWLALMMATEREIFIYCATLTLAILAYHFVQNSTDLFGRHLVGFFLWGTALLGLIFLAAVARNLVRFRRPTLFLPPAKWRHRFLYAVPVGLLGVAVFGSWGVATSSNPIFCGSCHEMRSYFSDWKSSPHARSEIGCPACHYEPGVRGYAKAKMRGFSELVISLTGASSAPKPAARVSDETCLRSGCHSTRDLAGVRYPRRLFYFNHATHLRGTFVAASLGAPAKNWRGPELRCTSCHTDVGPESHFAVDTNACFTCHFETGTEPRPAIATVGCVNCHAVPQGGAPSGPGSDRFDHVAAGVTPDADCAGCHAGLSRGSVAVEERQCRHCHLERSEDLLRAGTTAIHRQHVRDAAIGCDWCHGVIRHHLDRQSVATARAVASAKERE